MAAESEMTVKRSKTSINGARARYQSTYSIIIGYKQRAVPEIELASIQDMYSKGSYRAFICRGAGDV